VDQGVVALWVMAHVFGKPLSYIGYGGTGKQVRDVLHVQDLCELITLQITRFEDWEGWVGNVAGGLANSTSLLELTDLCQKITGASVPIRSDPETRPFDLRLFIADCARLFDHTDWRPGRDMHRIVFDTTEWVRTTKDSLIRLQ
jgi:CDP-paratose 2-epimerase